MGRSVSRPSNATATVYLHMEEYFAQDEDTSWLWDDFRDGLEELIKGRYKSFDNCDRWVGREDHAILENGHAYVTVSEYCGTVAICISPKDDDYHHPELSVAWAEEMAANFEKFIQSAYPDWAMVAQGHMSNGVQVFKPISRPNGVVTSNEGVLW